MPDFRLLFEPLRDWSILAGLLLLPGLALAINVYRRTGSWLPPRRHRAVPWDGRDVIGGFLLSTFIVALFVALLHDVGWYQALSNAASEDKELLKLRRGLWGAALALPWQIILVFFWLRQRSDARPYQLGWTTHRLRQNVLVGFVYWLALMPGILWFNVLVGYVYTHTVQSEPEMHAIQRLVEGTASRPDWWLAVLTAVVAAPLVEEFMYRGVLQPWVTGGHRRGDIVMGVSLMLAAVGRFDGIAKALEASSVGDLGVELQPAAFVLILLPVYAWLRRKASPAAGGIFAGAMFFAIVHAPVWPSPVPLLPLGLTLGYLAWRTQSLVGPIVLHMLFNSVAMLGLLHHDAAKGKDDTTTLWRAPSVSASSAVPGASFPRRT